MSHTDPAHPETPPRPIVSSCDLSALVGSRKLVVHFWLTQEQGQLDVCVIPTATKNPQDLKPLAKHLRVLFEAGRSLYEPYEWEEVTGDTPATSRRRLFLLARLLVNPTTRQLCWSLAKFKGLRRNFVYLPNGLPVGLTCLIPDGKKTSSSDIFSLLPEAVQLWVLGQALDKEKQEGKAWKNKRLAKEIQQVLKHEGLGLSSEIPEKCLKNFRTRLNRAGLGHVFPIKENRKEALSSQIQPIHSEKADDD